MNYKHIYHAGNFADVLKHCVLIAILQSLSEKDKPFCYLETHAGAGIYPLSFAEHTLGIDKIMSAGNFSNPTLDTYLSLVHEAGFPNFYPGSPRISEQCMKSDFRKIFFELQPDEADALKRNILFPKTTFIYQENGYGGLKSQLPPIEKRGLILIDPPYEKNTEFQDILVGITEALKRFATGVYMIWYPIKDIQDVTDFINLLKDQINQPWMNIELCLYPFETANLGLVGSGLIVINPPWKLREKLDGFLPVLWNCLAAEKQGYYKVTEFQRN